ncbi:MAG: PcfK-like family protein [Methylococcales bacterium]|nr:PcfK-like family protein [Methylococcales bacterium]
MKTTNKFKETIQEALNFRAFSDPLFAKTLAKPNKNIDNCINYILKTVKDSGCNGFEDEEIIQMAVHYYDEDDLKDVSKVNANVVVNHQVKLTQKDIAKAKAKALQEVVDEEKNRIKKRPSVKTTPKAEGNSQSLF